MNLLRKSLHKLYLLGAKTFPLAKEEHVRSFRITLAKHKMSSLPKDYIQFLQLTDGMTFNGLRFFGIHSHEHKEKGYTDPSLLDINMDYKQRNRGVSQLIVGEMDETLITYNPKKNIYQLMDRMDLMPELNLPRFFDVLYLLTEDLIKQPEQNIIKESL